MATQNPGFGDTPSASGIDLGASANTISNAASDAAHAFGAKAQDLGNHAKAALGDLRGKAHDTAADLREQAMKYKDQALDQARTVAEEGKTRAAETIHGVAGDLREAATTLGRNQTIAPVGKYANQAADALEEFAGTLRDKNVGQLVTEVSGFVRRNPAVAVGIAVAAGFALTQLLRGGKRTASGYDDSYGA